MPTFVHHDARVDELLTIRGDGTGLANQAYAPKTITGGTTGDPVVLTLTSHGFLVGDWVFITGATGITEINGVMQVETVPNANTFTVQDGNHETVGSAGTFGGTVLISPSFVWAPHSGHAKVQLARMNFTAASTSWALDGMLSVARLANGITINLHRGAIVDHELINFKGWNDLSLYTGGGDSPVQDVTNNKYEASSRWTLTRNAEGMADLYTTIRLDPDKNEFIAMYCPDDLSGLTALRCAVQGITE